MGIPDNIRENVRAVLLSKTDGSGILVSTFLRDYKNIILKPLLYKDLGFQTLENFIKDLPDVCRLEYCDRVMAYKLFGIAKPNTFVSSFVKRAEGNELEKPDFGRKSSRNSETITSSSDLNEKWEPSHRGLYTLCFPNTKGNGLNTKDDVAMKFAQLGEVVEINSIKALTFVRFRDEMVAKKALQLFGDDLKVRRADERSNHNREKNRLGNGSQNQHSPGSTDYDNNKRAGNKWGRSEPQLNDENWDNNEDNQGSNSCSYVSAGHNLVSDDNIQGHQNSTRDQGLRNDDRPRGTRGEGDGSYPRQDDVSHQSDLLQSELFQVYVGNWPHDAGETDLRQLSSAYNACGFRIITSKESEYKKYAFLDFKNMQDANRMVNELNNTMYKSRSLKIRMGNRKPTSDSHDGPTPDGDSHKGGIERDFENLCVHRGLTGNTSEKPAVQPGLLPTPKSRFEAYEDRTVEQGFLSSPGNRLEEAGNRAVHPGPVSRPGNRLEEAGNRAVHPGPVSRPGNILEEAGNRAVHPGPVSRPGNRLEEAGNCAVHPGPVSRPGNRLEEAGNCAVHPGPVARPGNRLEEPGNRAVHPGPMSRPGNRMPPSDGHNVSHKMPLLEHLADISRGMPPLENIISCPADASPSMPMLERHSIRGDLQDSSPSMPMLERHSRRGDLQDSMPRLEHRNLRSYAQYLSPSMPVLESHRNHEDIPDLEKIGVNDIQNGDSYCPVQLNIGNFPYGTSEHEIMRLLAPYGCQKINIMNKDNYNRSTYAFASFETQQQAMNAMEKLDQTMFMRRKIVVTLSNPGIVHQSTRVAPIPNLTCTVAEPTRNADRVVSVQDVPQMSRVSTRSSKNNTATTSETISECSLQPNSGNFNYQRLTTTLQEYSKIATKLRAEDEFQYTVGMTLKVMITHIENQKIFWGQILEDSENGVNTGLQRLQVVADEIQTDPKVDNITGLGRCLAKFENEWFRAWCTFVTERNGVDMGDLLFIDYGNRAVCPKVEMFKNKPSIWNIPPMAKPFKMLDYKHDLDRYLNQVVIVEVVEAGTSRHNCVTIVRCQWT